jgi:hypothetical protein
MDKKNQPLMTTMVFLLFVFGFSIVNIVSPDQIFSEAENRYLATMPSFSFEKLLAGKFTEEYETYVTDQFVFRDQWTNVKTLYELSLQKKDNNGVYFGKDGYLLGKHDEALVDREQLSKNFLRLSAFLDRCARELGDDRVSLLMVPTSSAVLKEKLPLFATGFDEKEMLDVQKNEMQKGSFVDAFDALFKHRDNDIFYKTDHHWTSLGAYFAYQKWCEAVNMTSLGMEELEKQVLTNEFYGTYYAKANLYTLAPDSIWTYVPKKKAAYLVTYNLGERVRDTLYDLDALKKRDRYTVFLSGNNPLVKIETDIKNGRKILMVKDSFAHTFAPFVVNHFEEVHMIDLRYYNMSISDYMKENGITDVLVLYNTINFAKDTHLYKLTL